VAAQDEPTPLFRIVPSPAAVALDLSA
jgi:hypothetical protein